jgi:hypothetical protein
LIINSLRLTSNQSSNQPFNILLINMGILLEDLATARTEDSYNDVCLVGLDWNEDDVREMVRLRSAADFFELQKLRNATGTLLLSLMMKQPAMTCAVVDELSALGKRKGHSEAHVLGSLGSRQKLCCFPAMKSQGEAFWRAVLL